MHGHVFAFINQPSFGRLPQGARLERIKRSPHYHDGQFNNLHPTQMMTSDEGRFGAMLSFLFRKTENLRPKTPFHHLVSQKPQFRLQPRNRRNTPSSPACVPSPLMPTETIHVLTPFINCTIFRRFIDCHTAYRQAVCGQLFIEALGKLLRRGTKRHCDQPESLCQKCLHSGTLQGAFLINHSVVIAVRQCFHGTSKYVDVTSDTGVSKCFFGDVEHGGFQEWELKDWKCN